CTKVCSRLFKIGVATGSLSTVALLVCHSLLHFLRSRGLSLDKPLLPVAFGARTHHVCPGCLFASLRRRDLGLGLIDSGECLLNTCMLKFALATIVLQRSFGCFHGSNGLCDLGLEVVILQLDQKISLVYLLEIRNFHVFDDAGYFRAKRREIATHIGIVGHLLDSSSLPCIPVTRDRGDDCDCQQDHHNRRHVFLPTS